MQKPENTSAAQAISIQVEDHSLLADLSMPEQATGMVLFAHGSGSNRLSKRSLFVSKALQRLGFGTLMMDLLSEEEERVDFYTRHLRFDIAFLARRLLAGVNWLKQQPETAGLPLGLYAASTTSAASLVVAAQHPELVRAVVCRGGRPDLSVAPLQQVKAPTLLIVGGFDIPVIDLNRAAYASLTCVKNLAVVPGATHLFEEPGALDEVAFLTAEWFKKYL